MSHIVTITTEVRDPAAIAAACRRLGLPEPVQGTARLFEGEATGLLVTLPGWLYPCVCNPATGHSATTTMAARGASRSTSTGSCKPTRWKRPAWRRGSAATRSSSRPSPTAR